MKPIKIEAKNEAAINAAIKAAEGRATERTCDYSSCLRAIELTEQHPAMQLLTKAQQKGARAWYYQHVKVAASYKYAPANTRLCIERRASGWFLSAVYRNGHEQAEQIRLELTAEQSAQAQTKFRQTYRVMTAQEADQ